MAQGCPKAPVVLRGGYCCGPRPDTQLGLMIEGTSERLQVLREVVKNKEL